MERLTHSTDDTAQGAQGQPTPGVPLPPLLITGLVVSKKDLLRTLSLYVPHLVDVVQLDEARFILSVDAASPHANGVAHE